MARINPQRVAGNWVEAIALDFHVLRAAAAPSPEKPRLTELGDLIHRLKYGADGSVIPAITAIVVNYLEQHSGSFDVIVPVPPSSPRSLQPVIVLANNIGASLAMPVLDCVSATKDTSQIDDEHDADKRRVLIDGLYAVDAQSVTGRDVLLFDDRIRSGVTIDTIAGILKMDGGARSVQALALTLGPP